jgi:hypothetical protein
MQATLWYVNDGNGPQGPMPEAQIVGLLAAGQIRPTAVFAPQGSSAWLRIDQVPAFQRALPQAQGMAPQGMPHGQPMQPMQHQAPSQLGQPQHGQMLGMMAPGMVAPGMRPQPARPKSQAGAIAAVVIGCLAVVGWVGYRYVGRRSYADLPQVAASFEKEKLSKDGKTLTLTLKLESETKGPVSVYVTSAGQSLTPLAPAEVEEGVLKIKLDANALPAGESELKLSINAEGFRGLYDLTVKVKMPPKLTGSGSRLWVTGRQGSVEVKDGSIKVDGEKGTKVTVGSQEITVTGAAAQQTPLDVVALLEKKKASELASANAKVPVVLTYADGTKLTGELQLYGAEIGKALGLKLKGAMKGPVSFGKGDEAPPKPRAIVDITGSTFKLYGDGPGPKAIDLVADSDFITRTSSCGTYRNSVTGVIVSIGREMNDQKYTIYERRTGKVVGSRFFRAPLPECPETLTQEQTVTSYVDSSEVDAYLQTLVGK